jgi:hypothetical protein
VCVLVHTHIPAVYFFTEPCMPNHAEWLQPYCPFAHNWQAFFVDPLPSKMRTEGNFQARFIRRKSIGFNKLYRLTSSFFALRKFFETHFGWQCVMPGEPGLYGGLYGQNLPYKFKKSHDDFRNRNFEKSHRTTGPQSDLRPNSCS